MREETILDRALAATRADEALVTMRIARRAYVRFGANEIRFVGESNVDTLTIRAAFGHRHGSASGNDLSDAGVRAIAERAMAAAKLSPEDPEFVEALGPQRTADTKSFDSATAQLAPQARAAVANDAIALARGAGLQAAGFVETSDVRVSLASSRGLRLAEPRTTATYTVTMRTPDGTGSGWGAANAASFAEIDAGATTRRAMDHAAASRSPRPVEPGVYPVVLEPDAIADLVHNLASASGAREAEEGRSYASAPGGKSRVGETLFAPLVTLTTDPIAMRSASFDGEGLPILARSWIEKGTLASLSMSRAWGKKTNRAPTTSPTALRMAGGAASLEELLAPIERGLYIPRIHYIRSVDPRNVLLTGMTRDGVRLIEHGKLAGPAKNLRWTQSVVELLAGIEALGATRRLITYEFEDSPIEVPAVRAKAFRFTGVTDSV